MTIDEFFEKFQYATGEFPFEERKWEIPPSKERKPYLFAQFHQLPTGVQEGTTDPPYYTPIKAVARLTFPAEGESCFILSNLEWGKKLGLSPEDTLNILYAQEGVLDTHQRQVIRDVLDRMIIDSYEGAYEHVPCWRLGIWSSGSSSEPNRVMTLSQFYRKFEELAKKVRWERVPWPSSFAQGDCWQLLTRKQEGKYFLDDPITLVAREVLSWDEQDDLEFSSLLTWARCLGLEYGYAQNLVDAVRGMLSVESAKKIRQKLDQIIERSAP